MPLAKIAVIGANGKLGPCILNSLLSTKRFTVSVLSRASSKSTYSVDIRVITIPDSLEHGQLTESLRGQDALVIIMAGSRVTEQIALADACFEAGVQRVIPADFGSCDSADIYTQNLLPLFAGKAKVRKHLDQLSSKPGSVLSWTGIVTGHFFDYGLCSGLLKFDLGKHKAWILDSGERKWSATTLDTIGLATSKVLEKDIITKNKLLYIQSFCINQNEVLHALERATGAHWEVERVSSHELMGKAKERTNQGDVEATEEIVSVHGLVASNWEEQGHLANDILDLPYEDLDRVIRMVLSK